MNWSEIRMVKGMNSKISSNVDGFVTVNKSPGCFLKSMNIYITLYHIILMICMLFKVQYLKDYITVHVFFISMLQMWYLSFKMVNKMDLRVYFRIIVFMLPIDLIIIF